VKNRKIRDRKIAGKSVTVHSSTIDFFSEIVFECTVTGFNQEVRRTGFRRTSYGSIVYGNRGHSTQTPLCRVLLCLRLLATINWRNSKTSIPSNTNPDTNPRSAAPLTHHNISD
jgi:hypothetical protein